MALSPCRLSVTVQGGTHSTRLLVCESSGCRAQVNANGHVNRVGVGHDAMTTHARPVLVRGTSPSKYKQREIADGGLDSSNATRSSRLKIDFRKRQSLFLFWMPSHSTVGMVPHAAPTALAGS